MPPRSNQNYTGQVIRIEDVEMQRHNLQTRKHKIYIGCACCLLKSLSTAVDSTRNGECCEVEKLSNRLKRIIQCLREGSQVFIAFRL